MTVLLLFSNMTSVTISTHPPMFNSILSKSWPVTFTVFNLTISREGSLQVLSTVPAFLPSKESFGVSSVVTFT